MSLPWFIVGMTLGVLDIPEAEVHIHQQTIAKVGRTQDCFAFAFERIETLQFPLHTPRNNHSWTRKNNEKEEIPPHGSNWRLLLLEVADLVMPEASLRHPNHLFGGKRIEHVLQRLEIMFAMLGRGTLGASAFETLLGFVVGGGLFSCDVLDHRHVVHLR